MEIQRKEKELKVNGGGMFTQDFLFYLFSILNKPTCKYTFIYKVLSFNEHTLINIFLLFRTPHLSLKISVGKNTIYSAEDECWIHYKNNHFQMSVDMECNKMELFTSPFWIFDSQYQTSFIVDNLFVGIYHFILIFNIIVSCYDLSLNIY